MKTKYLSFILLLLAFSSCSEKELSPISGSLGKPGIVTDVTVEPLAGGADPQCGRSIGRKMCIYFIW